MKLSDDLTWRGLIKDQTFGTSDWLDEPKTFYLGIDASADSLTVGNLAVIILARRLAAAGWKSVLLMGGGTSLVGDPGGKTEERQLISREAVEKNIANVKAQTEKLFDSEKFEMLDNYTWLSKLKYVDFLRDVGKHFSMTELMQREFVTERMGSGGAGISYAEFSYSLVQGYDFWYLFKEHGVVLQIGGSDQWGNMLSGIALIRKKEGKEAQALSMPLVVNKETGQKFGKSEGGAIWLEASRTTIFKFYQFWLNMNDDDTEQCLKVFTLLGREEIQEIVKKFDQDKASRWAQERLAFEVTKLVHGGAQANKQLRIAQALVKSDISKLDEAEIATIREEVTVVKSEKGQFLDEIVIKAGLANSRTEATRLIGEGAIYINGIQATPKSGTWFVKGNNLLRRGKAFKDSALIELE